ncbi:MAG: hypothetical protein ABSF23_14645 [Terracidiphilus sp.]|jgi:hypothetical protein
MAVEVHESIRVADRIWIAAALLQRESPSRSAFSKREISERLEAEGLAAGVERGTISAHLDQHMVANVPPSSGKYRMLFETAPGSLRLFRAGDLTHPARFQRRKPAKAIPNLNEMPERYRYLLDWYAAWSRQAQVATPQMQFEEDPLILLIGSGREIWADEHADEYVENLRREEI